jgi:ribosomal protein S18 acetylase RimI-like enzyme
MYIKKIDFSEYQLVTALFDKYRIFYNQPSDIRLAERFIKERLENDESVIFVALVDDDGKPAPVGFTQLYPLISSMRAAKNWLLNDLYVESDNRRQGIGQALIKTAMDFAREQKASFIKLETAFDNYTAQSLYEAVGFIKQEPGKTFIAYTIQVQ